MFQYEHHFTLDEARALLPRLRHVLQLIQRGRQQLHKADKALAELLAKTGGDIGGEPASTMLGLVVAVNQEFARLREWGVVVKDLDRGLIDFPHVRDGREVFLCWELDEDDIEFWHDVDTGYAGRQRL
jgi:hypothetical protein